MPRHRTPLTATALLVQPHLAVARRHQLCLTGLYQAHRVDPARLNDSEAHVPLAFVFDLWRTIGRQIREPHYGLYLSAQHDIRTFDVLGYVMLSAHTIGDAVAAAVRFQRLLFSFQPLSLVVEDGLARYMASPPPHSPGELHDFTLGSALASLRGLAGERLTARAVRLRHAAPEDVRAYREFFGVTPEFNAAVNELAFDAEVLARPGREADPRLQQIMHRYAQEQFARVPEGHGVVNSVRREISQSLQTGVPTAADVARRLGMSARSLHRYLADEGTRLSELVDEVRRDTALAQLRQPTRKTLEIAFMLGFSELSTFHRAFRRWTGTTPADFRRAEVGASS